MGQAVPAGLYFKGEVPVSGPGGVSGPGVRLPQRVLRRAHRRFGPGAHPPPGQPARVGIQLPFKNTGILVSGAEAGGGVSGGARADGDLPAELPQLGHGVSGVARVQHRRPGGPAAVFPGPAPELASGTAL